MCLGLLNSAGLPKLGETVLRNINRQMSIFSYLTFALIMNVLHLSVIFGKTKCG